MKRLTKTQYKQILVEEAIKAAVNSIKTNDLQIIAVHTIEDFAMVAQLLIELSIDIPEADNVCVEIIQTLN
tara:strand:- start:1 stop:213 length:213 start_codon:yes stop_codon:yes gene_type:complete